jgi:hypothetical protein
MRQRAAFALSEIFVISDVAGTLRDDPVGMAEYYDILVRRAFGNYRTLLEDVTKSPQMGKYLSMLKNQKADPANNCWMVRALARRPRPSSRPSVIGWSRRILLPSTPPQPAATSAGSMCSARVSASFMTSGASASSQRAAFSLRLRVA